MLRKKVVLLIVLAAFVLQGWATAWAGASLASLVYPIVNTGQIKCYDNNKVITPPALGQAFYGQDAQYRGNQAKYTISADGLTVADGATGLTWQRSPDTNGDGTVATSDKLTWAQAEARPAALNAVKYGGYSDWRLPTIKELYSLITFTGTDPSSFTGTDTSVLTPFINTAYFKFAYGDPNSGERIIDAQYASSTVFILNPAQTGSPKVFGVNFADGRIKGYDLQLPGTGQKTFFVQCVRGGSTYGKNDFHDNKDGTITDNATALMWTKADSGTGMTWQAALSWAQSKNSANYLGHNDWRLPNAKELQSIVDYENAPDYNGKPAINTTYFNSTSIVNENGDTDYPYYWTSTTHAGYAAAGLPGDRAVYVAFGRALGWPNNGWTDVHGAGAQRSDPKIAPPYSYAAVKVVSKNGVKYTGYSFGPQGDALRGLNFVRLVRDIAGGSGKAADAINSTYSQYASYFGAQNGGVASGGTPESGVYYVQWFINGTAILAWIDGYMYFSNGSSWNYLGTSWQ
ncbi:DUF1566 domain-containing protein [Candidatus Magnetominusculus dajiuhuensis]|uniref:Lcl C-terminal domain-containing protein n=1 Tax=Candidatus Magnetominusculus dajiuhuensis TaxID=3137712 RepID=UPI003B437448